MRACMNARVNGLGWEGGRVPTMGTDLQASKKVSTGTPFHLASIVNSWYVTVCCRHSRRPQSSPRAA
jgi:hypothetical protein